MKDKETNRRTEGDREEKRGVGRVGVGKRMTHYV